MTAEFEALAEIPARGASAHPDVPALQSAHDRDAGFTYSALDAFADCTAVGLQSVGLGAGDKVIMLLEACPAWAPVFFGVLRGGMVAVPLPAGTPPEVIRAAASFTGARCLVFSDSTRGAASSIEGLNTISVGELLRTTARGYAPRGVDPTDLAMLAFTSGSTAAPRVVEISHQNLLADLNGILRVRRVRTGDRFLSVLPPVHVFELLGGLLGPLACGATVVYPGPPLPNRIVAALRTEVCPFC